jgi:hypothetical protein
MLTLNQIKEILVDFFNEHAQVNTVIYADDFDYNAERNQLYPAINIQYLSSNISNKTINHTFKFVYLNYLTEGNINLNNEIYSDGIQIAEDFFSFIGDYEGIIFSKSSNIQKFKNDTGDMVAGIVFTLIISVMRPQNKCVIPKK